MSGSDDKSLKIWDIATGQCTSTLTGHSGRIFSVSWSLDSTIASGSSDKKIKVWDSSTGQCKETLEGHTDSVHDALWSPDGTLFMSGADDNELKGWNLATGQCTSSLTGHTDWVKDISFSPDSTQIASASMDHTVKIWDLSTGQCKWTLDGHGNPVYAVAWSPQRPGRGLDNELAGWMQELISLQDQLRLLESSIGGIVDKSIPKALEAIANGLAKLNELLDFWPDYTGNDATNEQRKAIINSASDLISSSAGTVKFAEENARGISQV